MVEFNKDGFSIHIKTQHAPGEHWKNTVDDIIGLLQTETTSDTMNERFFILELLKQMMPDINSKKQSV
jgi:hypothetical protein